MASLVDGALHHLGKPGGFHLLVAILLCCNFFPITFHHMSMVFYGESIPHTCRLPEGWPWHKKFSIPKVTTSGVQSKYDECHMFVDPNSAALGTKSCVYGWEFYPQGREWTIIAEWGLVCEREYLVTLAAVVYHGGVMFGGLVFGTLADKFGRKPLMLFTLYAQTVISVGIYFVQNFILFVILRFVHGLLLQGLQCSTICLVMELLPMRYRTAAGMGCSIAWGLGMISLSLVSYSVQHWRYIQLAISLPCVVTFLYIWLIPESVRWLLTVMKTEKALLTAQKFEQFNKRPLGENFSKDVETATKQVSSNMGQVESYGMRELLLQGSKLRISSLVLCFCWFATSSLYNGLTLMLLKVGSNRYTSMVIIGSVDLVAFIVMYFLLVRFGRKRPICALLVLCGAVCISTVVAENLEIGHTLEVYVVSTVLVLVERSCAAACLAGLTICAAELFPTVIRTFGIGVCLFCGQFGWLMAPQILKLSQFSLKALPWITFGIMSLLAGLLVLLLPETLTKPLPDTLEDMENFESRKAAVVSKDKEVAQPPAYGQDWATTYKRKIEEANGTLSTMEAEDHKEVSEKRWYARNHSRRSAKVVRFYGLDCSEDPCQEVKTSKKQRIRMVRFSFESEEQLPKFRVVSCAPVAAARFSVIQEEPELETALDEGAAVLRLGQDAPLHAASMAQPVNDHAVAGTVNIVSLPDVTVTNLPLAAVEPQPVLDNGFVVSPKSETLLDFEERKSRFLVLRVSDPPTQDASMGKDATSGWVEDDRRIVPVENQPVFMAQLVAEEPFQPVLLHELGTYGSGGIGDGPCGVPKEIGPVGNEPPLSLQKVTGDLSANWFNTADSPLCAAADGSCNAEGSLSVVMPLISKTNGTFPQLAESKSRFVVQKVVEMPNSDACEIASGCSSDGEFGPGTSTTALLIEGKQSRFSVKKVLEPSMPIGLQKMEDLNDIVGTCNSEVGDVPPVNCESLGTVVRKVDEKSAENGPEKAGDASVNGGDISSGTDEAPLMPNKPSRFVVQRVVESKASDNNGEIVGAKNCNGEGGSRTASAPLANGKPSRFVVQKVPENTAFQGVRDTNGNVSECNSETASVPVVDLGPSRFLVQKVTEQPLTNGIQKTANANRNANEHGSGTATFPLVDGKQSRFTVRRVSDSKLTLPGSQVMRDKMDKNCNGSCATNGTNANTQQVPPVQKSRFLVQRVADDVLKVVHLNNNNNNINNNNNNDQILTLGKLLEASNTLHGPFCQDERENLENVQQVAFKNGNTASVSSADFNNEDGSLSLKLHLKHADVASNS